MRNTAICSCLIFGLLVATSVQAESYRTTVKKSAKSSLTFYSIVLEKMKKGQRLCGIGGLSTWGATITRVSDEGRSNGLEPGDKVLKLNGEQVTETNSTRIFHKYKPDDELTLIIERNQGEIELNVICDDRTETLQAFASMLQAAAKGRWQQCIDNSYVADRLNGERISFSAMYRLNCNEARRCGFAGCKNPTSQDAQLVYDYRILALEEAIVAGDVLDDVRADILTGITWLEESGFRRLANDLEVRFLAAEARPERSIAKRRAPAGQITAYGTCFAVSPTEVLTSHHVVADANQLLVQFQDGREIEAVIAQQSRSTDLALLKINGQTPESLRLAAPRSLAVGEPVFTLGFPVTSILGEEAKFTEGSVSALSGIQGDATYFQMSVPIQPGNSGGPVVNMQGEVVGIVASTAAIESFYVKTGVLPQNVNWASKSDYARLLFDPPADTKKAGSRQEAIERVRSALCKVKAIQN